MTDNWLDGIDPDDPKHDIPIWSEPEQDSAGNLNVQDVDDEEEQQLGEQKLERWSLRRIDGDGDDAVYDGIETDDNGEWVQLHDVRDLEVELGRLRETIEAYQRTEAANQDALDRLQALAEKQRQVILALRIAGDALNCFIPSLIGNNQERQRAWMKAVKRIEALDHSIEAEAGGGVAMAEHVCGRPSAGWLMWPGRDPLPMCEYHKEGPLRLARMMGWPASFSAGDAGPCQSKDYLPADATQPAEAGGGIAMTYVFQSLLDGLNTLKGDRQVKRVMRVVLESMQDLDSRVEQPLHLRVPELGVLAIRLDQRLASLKHDSRLSDIEAGS